MPLIQDSHDSLPYIDPEPTLETREKISALLASELPPNHATTLHPSIPPLPSLKLSPLIESEMERMATKIPLKAIDTSRYEALDEPTTTDSKAWKATLRKAYTTSTYLTSRLQNLALLESFGKNAWLIGNSQLEDILKGLEREIAELKEQGEQVERERFSAQDGVKGEMVGLDETWKKGIGTLVEVEVAAEQGQNLHVHGDRGRRKPMAIEDALNWMQREGVQYENAVLER
ncbi:MAG: hypothetical protein MMC33_002571 [Icmadophila ericetorum]|nr:hypothetical protein [Icmadophila ericetorum]